MKCDTTHRHVSLEGGRAKATAKYPRRLCEEICRRYVRYKRHNVEGLRMVAQVRQEVEAEKIPDKEVPRG